MKQLSVTLVLFVGGSLAAFFLWYLHYQSPGLSGSVPTTIPVQTLFSLDQAPKNALRGTITSQSGRIDWQSRTAAAPIQLPANIVLQQGETLIASTGATLTASFADAGTIRLGSAANMDIIQTLPDGLVFVQKNGTVTYTARQSLPVSVRSFHLLSTIAAGAMTTSIDTDVGTIKVAVTKGRAIVAFNDTDLISQVIAVDEGKSFLFNDESRSGELL